MPIIHPTYWTDTGRWSAHDRSAPTVAELLAKLGPGYACRDYYPFGVGIPLTELPRGLAATGGVRQTQMKSSQQYARREPVQRSERIPALREPRPQKTSVRPPDVALAPVYPRGPDRDSAVADLWAQGRTQSQIGWQLGIGVNSVASILYRLRARGDPRAATRS